MVMSMKEAKPELMSTIRAMSQLQQHMRGAKRNEPTGYSAVAGATKMLNDMLSETKTNLDVEETRCTNEDRRMTGSMEVMRQAVSNFNAAAAGARGRVVGAQGSIATLEVNKETTEEAFEQHKLDCKRDIKALKYELAIVTADAGVMTTVLNLIGPCPAPTANLVQCDTCGNVMLQHPDIHHLLTGLKSQAARNFVADNLKQTFDESVAGQAPMGLTQEGAEQMLSMLQHTVFDQMRTIQRHLSSTGDDHR